MHEPDGIQTPKPTKQATADLRLRPRDPWDRWMCVCIIYITHIYMCMQYYISSTEKGSECASKNRNDTA